MGKLRRRASCHSGLRASLQPVPELGDGAALRAPASHSPPSVSKEAVASGALEKTADLRCWDGDLALPRCPELLSQAPPSEVVNTKFSQ